MNIPVFPAIVSTWRAAKVRELRKHAANVRAAYTWPAATVHTFAYADALDRAAGVLEADPMAQPVPRKPSKAWAPLFITRSPEPSGYALATKLFSYRVQLDYEDVPGWSWRVIECDFDGEPTPCESAEAGMFAAEDDARAVVAAVAVALDEVA